MRHRVAKLALMMAVLLVLGLVPALAADATAPAEDRAAPVELPLLACGDALVFGSDDEAKSEVGLTIGPPREILGCVAKTCDDYPVPIGGSCSCTSQIIKGKCLRTCDDQKGKILETSCTICPGCASPPCDIAQCNTRTSRSCVLP